jgi:hypothetical protein
MEEFVEVLQEEGMPIPPLNPDPQILIHNANEFRAA